MKRLYLAILLLLPICMTAPGYAMSDTTFENQILQQINAYRLQHHRPALTMKASISQQAKIHSEEMAKHIMPFGHQGFNTRIQLLFKEFGSEGGGAENIAYNYKTAKIVVDGWISSSGHRRNILGNYNLTGIGLARDEKGKIYFTQIFVKSDKG